MKTNVRDTSIDCYYGGVSGILETGQAEMVADFVLRQGGKITRRQVARGLQMETGTVSARVNKLVADGVLVEGEENERIKCPITGKLVYWINHRDNARGQLTLI
jgi:DNA-binding MarR family transcriptional regulator